MVTTAIPTRSEELIDFILTQMNNATEFVEDFGGTGNEEAYETGRLFFRLWFDHPGITQQPAQPDILDNVLDIQDVQYLLDTYEAPEEGTADNEAQIVFTALTSCEIQFRIDVYQDGGFEVFHLENLSAGQAVERLGQILVNGGNPYDINNHVM